MHTLLLEPSGHFTGDMLVGLLCDLGVKPSTFEWELAKVDLGAFHLHFERRIEGEVQGIHFGIHTGAVHTHDQDADEGTSYETHAHSHDDDEAVDEHEHHHHDHDDHEGDENDLSAAQVRERLDASELPDAVKARVLSVFDQFCVHEAKSLDAEPQDLTFDEDSALSVGAQIVCVCTGLAELGVEHVSAAAPPEESVAAGILAVYRSTDEGGSAPAEAKPGCGIGDEGWLRGVLG